VNNRFAEYRPDSDLIPFVQSYWFGDFNTGREKDFSQSVVPNGCIELIIHISENHCALTLDKTQWRVSPDFTILGMHTAPYEVKFNDYVKVFGIRFYPDGISNVFDVPPALFLSTWEDSAHVLGKNLEDFGRRVQTLNSPESICALANAFIRTKLQSHYRKYDYTHPLMSLIRSEAGTKGYQQLTREIPISERQLQRTFRSLYGITVGEYLRLARMSAIYDYMHSKHQSLTETAHDLQFFDQSHFIREFRNYVGTTPGRFLKSRKRFIVNPVKDHSQGRSSRGTEESEALTK
jgi:AraC-like DNA-binding protein